VKKGNSFKNFSKHRFAALLFAGLTFTGMLTAAIVLLMFLGTYDGPAEVNNYPAVSGMAVEARPRAPKAPSPLAVFPAEPFQPYTPAAADPIPADRTTEGPRAIIVRNGERASLRPLLKRIARRLKVARFVPTTLVIYAENGVIKSRVEPQVAIINKKSLSIRN
jgi:hypothetical protein